MWKRLIAGTLAALASAAFAEAPRPPQRLPAATPEGQSLAAATNGFATDVFAQLRTRNDGNLFFSPYSISAAIAMAQEGAGGKTADEIAKALHLPGPEKSRAGFENLHTRLQASRNKAGFDLSVANRLWPMIGFELSPTTSNELPQRSMPISCRWILPSPPPPPRPSTTTSPGKPATASRI